MAKKRKYGSMRGMERSMDRMDKSMDRADRYMDRMVREEDYAGEMRKPGRVMVPNNGRRAPIMEDFSRPCGLPYGAIQRDVGNGAYFSMNAHRIGDLFEQVDKNMRDDAREINAITKPTNW